MKEEQHTIVGADEVELAAGGVEAPPGPDHDAELVVGMRQTLDRIKTAAET